MTIDFITLGNIIFKDKEKYKFITDEDKERNFFILNRKFGFKDIRKAQFFNHKDIDKATALDIWFNVFTNTKDIPVWYWKTKANKTTTKKPSNFKKEDLDNLKSKYNLKDNDVHFLIEHFEDDVKKKIKTIKKHEQK